MGRASRSEIPRWIQLLGLPVLLPLALALAGALRHAVFAFPDALRGRFRIPPCLAVAGVYLGFAAAVAFAIVGLATVVVDQTRQASDRVESHLTVEHGRSGRTDAERDLDRPTAVQLSLSTLPT
jgi:predicted PurR-regulated permease PerM